MTQEDKARAYDEALERAKELLDSPRTCFDINQLKDIFLELAESEDERIRKAIIHYILYETKGAISEATEHTWLKWLEKQKEQKPKHFELKAGKWYICHRAFCCRADHLTVKEGERFQCEKDGIVKGFVIKEPEKYFKECSAPAPMEDEQKEQKPSTPKYRVGDVMRTKQEAAEGITDGLPVIVSVDDDYYYCTNEKIPISEQEEYEFPPINMRQKPAEWSEEDRKHLNSVLLSLNRPFYNMNEQEKSDFDWLHELPERFNLQPKQEWSEEDERMLKWIEDILLIADDDLSDKLNGRVSPITDSAYSSMKLCIAKCLSWLKSLPPSWKPSEEQMNSLNLGIHALEEGGYYETASEIKELYEQLKKLM